MACSMPISLHHLELKVNRRCKEKNHHSGEFNYRISFVTVLQFVALLGIQPDAISFNTALGAFEAVHSLCCRMLQIPIHDTIRFKVKGSIRQFSHVR